LLVSSGASARPLSLTAVKDSLFAGFRQDGSGHTGSVLAVALTLLALTLPPTPGTTLRVTAREPLTLRAAGFGPLESVRVTVATRSGKTVRTVKSSPKGRFTVSFPKLALDGRTDLDVTAIGSRGHRASFSIRHTTGGTVSKV
jgi:hypothetical protein